MRARKDKKRAAVSTRAPGAAMWARERPHRCAAACPPEHFDFLPAVEGTHVIKADLVPFDIEARHRTLRLRLNTSSHVGVRVERADIDRPRLVGDSDEDLPH
eukprot:3177156-Prymnesium_polylepis.1